MISDASLLIFVSRPTVPESLGSGLTTTVSQLSLPAAISCSLSRIRSSLNTEQYFFSFHDSSCNRNALLRIVIVVISDHFRSFLFAKLRDVDVHICQSYYFLRC